MNTSNDNRTNPVKTRDPISMPLSERVQKALAFHQTGQLENAENLYISVLREYPQIFDSLHLLGALHLARKNPAKAIPFIEASLMIQPDNESAYTNLGIAFKEQGRFQQAAICYQKLIDINPQNGEAYKNLGIALTGLCKFDEAISAYERALALIPGHSEANYNLSLLLLAKGEFKSGWKKYQSRLEPPQTFLPRKFTQAEWLGDANLAGKSILLHAEQGLGDTLQFIRYAPMVAALGATVFLEVHKPLIPLLQLSHRKSLSEKCQLFAIGDPIPPTHYHCPLLSLPLAFGTELSTVPGTTPYLFASPERIKFWADKLGERARPRIGLAWSGNAQYPNDRNRSIALAEMTAIWSCIDCDFFAIQKDIRIADAQVLSATPAITNLASHLINFAETAAIIANLDLVITVDTSVGHLAGALGKAVWILLSSPADWRWMHDRNDSPWYPNVRLFRQASGNNWAPTFDEIRRALKSRFA